jgi:two-component system capsular synthesis response regulator RcsB
MNLNRPSPIHVVLLDDHAVVRYGLEHRLSQEVDINVVAGVADSRELRSVLQKQRCDVLVMDYELRPDDLDGWNLIRSMRTRFPELLLIVLSGHESVATEALTMRAGAHGFVGKGRGVEAVVAAIRSVLRGQPVFSRKPPPAHAALAAADAQNDPNASAAAYAEPLRLAPLLPGERPAVDQVAQFPPEISTLTPRETEVLRCCLQGLSLTEVAAKFVRSVKTVSTQKQSAYRKLGIRNDNELFKLQSGFHQF